MQPFSLIKFHFTPIGKKGAVTYNFSDIAVFSNATFHLLWNIAENGNDLNIAENGNRLDCIVLCDFARFEPFKDRTFPKIVSKTFSIV